MGKQILYKGETVIITKCGCSSGEHNGKNGQYIGTEKFRGKNTKRIDLGYTECNAIKIKRLE
jgi:hypothetical protein